GKVLFIAAEDNFQEGKNQNLLRPQDVEKVVNTFNQYEDIEKYARVVEMAEVETNDYNLNISRYIDKSIEEEQMDMNIIANDLKISIYIDKTIIEEQMYLNIIEY